MSARCTMLMSAVAAGGLALVMAVPALAGAPAVAGPECPDRPGFCPMSEAPPPPPPPSQSCAQALDAWYAARGRQSNAKAARDDAQTESSAAQAELAAAKALPEDDKAKAEKVAKAEARVAAADKDLAARQRAYDDAKAETVTRQAGADDGCKGAPGAPGKPGADGRDGAAGEVVTEIRVQPAPVIEDAPAPEVQQLDGSAPIVTH